MRRGGSLAVIAIITLSILAPVLAFPAKAATIPLSEVQQAINLGIQAVANAVKPIETPSGLRYVMPDHPSPTIMVSENGKLYVPGSFLDPGDRDYRTELVSVTPTSVSWRYYFNLDTDEDYDVIIYAELRNVDWDTDKLTILVEKSEYIIDLVVGTYYPYVYTGVSQGWNKVIYINVPYESWRYTSARYVTRHSTIIAAWLLEDAGYTGKAQGLQDFWRSLGFQYDVYAPVFGKSKDYPDNFFDYKVETWLGNGYSAQPWTTSPSDNYINYPYKSRMYIFDSGAIPGVDFNTALRGWKDAPLYLLLKAMHLLDKYGLSRKSEAEQLIAKALSEGGWDGYGLRKAMIDPLYVATGTYSSETVPYSYKGYPVYLNAVLLAALVKYYNVTGDRWINGQDILYMADRLAGILVRVQWNYEHVTPWGPVKLALFRGWWPAAYEIGSIIVKPSAWGIIDSLTELGDDVSGILAKLGYDVGEAVRPMPSEWPFAIVNSESTILATQALKFYLDLAQRLGRQPIDPTSPPTIGPEGSFVESGGGTSSGSVVGYEVADDGRWIRAWALADVTYSYVWAYGYAKYNVTAHSPGYYNVSIYGMVNYRGIDAWQTHAEVEIVVKLIDSSGNVLQTWQYRVAYLDNEVYVDETESISLSLRTGYLQAGTYYIEVGLKALAQASSTLFGDAEVNAVLHIDKVALEP